MLLKRLTKCSSAWTIFFLLPVNYSKSTPQGPCSCEITLLLGHWQLVHQPPFRSELSQHSMQFRGILWVNSPSFYTDRSPSWALRFEFESFMYCTSTKTQPRQFHGQYSILGSLNASIKPA